MDLSEIFGFLIILKETLVILPKNGKLVASIAFLSLLLSSILISLFVYFLQSLWANMLASYANPEYSDALYNPNNNNSNHVLKYTLLLLVVQLSFLFIFVIISNLLSTATILVSAFSYTGKKLDSKDLFSSIKRTWKKPFSRRFSSSSSSRFRSIAVVLAVIILYSSVVSALSVVISIVEVSSRMEALEKAEKLVEGGQRLHGFMLNLFFNLVALILILPASYYYIDKLSVNKFAIYYGLFFLNFVSLLNIFVFTAYTVFYYWCKKHHGEEEEEKEEDINVQYSQLPALDSDIP
ncbi:PREDICTED: uncharacterized protein LOC105952329 [Erythranthe guttata]|uniref:uncharacterized protein LOC105952329 n=1 Tax=Erythranthe guttata TaxID=4155 RepID=UPI00064DE722|nr:PREDICTED: uncharacterized protein LOC105952329 [Erythranthe guttata]|eukprot:XP_012831327.1 PREDICTED: uncharacterized protein LOC105952329 [Erythranthe guttata]